MSDAPFFMSELQPGKIISVNQFNAPDPLLIDVAGVVAGAGLIRVLKGTIHPTTARTYPPSPVALKVTLTLNSSSSLVERIRREVDAVRHIRHRYILPFIGVQYTERYAVLVSEFMENGNMLQYLKNHPAVNKGRLIFQVAVAVVHLHMVEGIVHGDLKCENVLISRDGDAQLADFGFSTTVEKPAHELTTATDIRISSTLRFAAPELLKDEVKSPSGRTRSKNRQTDVFAFGGRILQAFSGMPPWANIEDAAVIIKVTQDKTPPRPAHATAAGLSDSWWAMCRTCWKYMPEKRPSILDLELRIRSILGIPESGE